MNQFFKFYFVGFLYLFSSATVLSQQDFSIHKIKLPDEVAFYNNQFSSIQVLGNTLFLISESRLQDSAEAKMYVAQLDNLKKNLKDTNRILPFTKFTIRHLDVLRNKIKAAGGDYEGIEATIIENEVVYFSIETETASPDCYLLKGYWKNQSVELDTSFLIATPKFTGADGKAIYNAGYEAMVKNGDDIFAFYEYNSFPNENYVRVLDKYSFVGNKCQHLFPIQPLPFRITDITAIGNNHYTAINYFFSGGGPDAVYRPDTNDSLNNQLAMRNGKYKSFSRLIDVNITDSIISWQPIWNFPEQFSGHNWECIAAYRNGYFIMNDKYTTVKPYCSELLYLERK